MPARKISYELIRTREFIRRYVVLPDEELDVCAVWTMGTWTFSPASPAMPATYPYLYVNGPKGSGKTVLGQDVFGSICRNPQATVGVTGPALFRMIGSYDEESGIVIPHYPTLSIDEIDATYSGAKDEGLRQMCNAGYKRGAMVPRAAGKTTILFPVYTPKCLMGIDNGHLPDTVLDRSIRIDLKRAGRDERNTIQPFYSFDVEDEAAELSEALSRWAKDHAMALREYRPVEIDGLSSRQWEIARSLVQLAREIGNEDRIRQALHSIMTRSRGREDSRVTLYRAIHGLFSDTGVDRVTTKMILAKLNEDGISVPGNSGKGLSAVLSEEGITPDYLRLPTGHPGIVYEDDKPRPIQRGYYLHKFDDAFVKYLSSEDDE